MELQVVVCIGSRQMEGHRRPPPSPPAPPAPPAPEPFPDGSPICNVRDEPTCPLFHKLSVSVFHWVHGKLNLRAPGPL